MSLKTGLFSYLSANAGLVTLLGSGSASRIYPGLVPENAGLPYIRYRIITSTHVRDMINPNNVAMRRIQFDIYGATTTSVESVFSALRTALESFRGVMGTGGDAVTILSSGIETERDDTIFPTDASQVGIEYRSVDINIWHRL